MTTRSLTIAAGFGGRLREERERVGLNQAQLAEAAGIKRMAQGQYENEVRSPSVKYLAAIASAGIDLHYALFGSKAGPTQEAQRGLEKKVFEMVEQYARQQPDGKLGAEGRYAMFELLRAYLARSTDGDGASLPDPVELIAGYAVASA